MVAHRPVTRPSVIPLLGSLAMTASAAAVAVGSAACSSTAARFTGTEHPTMVSPEEVIDFGIDQPEGHDVIGVASVRCETTNGASGLLEVPCTEEAMAELLAERAAQAGGSGLVDRRCERPDTRRVLQNVDGGTVEQSTLSGWVCHATVVRRGEGVVVGATPGSSPRPAASGARRVTISGQDVDVGADHPAHGPSSTEVGVLEAFPDGYDDVGRIWARCVRGCARSLARRALLAEAGRHGAQAIAELSCSLEGERWRCEARMIGRALDTKTTPGQADPPGQGGGRVHPETGVGGQGG